MYCSITYAHKHSRWKIGGQSNFVVYQLSMIIWGERSNKGEEENLENIHLPPEEDVKRHKHVLIKNEKRH